MTARRWWGKPLAPLYGIVVGTKRMLLRWGVLKQRRLANPVISVGSLSAGGAGKTPVVLMLVKALAHRGYAPQILTRGYKRQSHGVERVLAGGDALWFGDEPVLLAERSGVPVFVGADRHSAGLLAEQEARKQGKVVVHVLDDGFQHLKLARDVDIVLLTREDVQDRLLPEGNLREPLSALESADILVVRDEELAWTDAVAARMARESAGTLMWVVRRSLVFREQEVLPVRPVVFCGIARPEGFLAMLVELGCEAAGTVWFEDHHVYDVGDMRRLVEEASRCEADGFVTTEKDAVKLTPALRKMLEGAGPMVVARLELELVDEKESIDKMIAMVKPMERRKKGVKGRKIG